MNSIEDDMDLGERQKLPQIYHPVIVNPKLAVNVTITCYDNLGNPTGESYETTIEQGCLPCEFGGLPTNSKPCTDCYREHTPERPYKYWIFDSKYDPRDDVVLN